MITPEPRRSGVRPTKVAAPVRRPSLIGAGIDPEEIEKTVERAMKFPL